MSATEDRECAHCGRPFVAEAGTGRPRKYCRRSCRQRAFEARRHEGDLAWGDRRLVAMARELATLEDAIDRVRVAVDELRADVEDERPVDGRALLDHLDDALRGEK